MSRLYNVHMIYEYTCRVAMHRYKDNFKLDLKEIRWVVQTGCLAQDRNEWRFPLIMTGTLQVL
jgi:hypothetical protein